MARVNLKVSLDTTPGANPAVIVSSRNVNLKGKNVRWKRDKNGPEFEFWRLNDLDQAAFPFQGINKKRTRAFCNNKAPDPSSPYEYTIIVKYDNVYYDTTMSGIPPNPKPVIRND